MDAMHRIMSGAPLTPTEVRAAGVIALGWFLMDLAQWSDWFYLKLWPVAVACIR